MSGFTAELDLLSPAARSALKLNASAAYTAMVAPNSGCKEAAVILEKMTAADVLSRPAVNRDDASAALAGLWLWHDWLEQSHKLAQSLQTTSGSFWHAIMHRREGDFSNSKYWYMRCADHPIFPSLTRAAADVINPYPADKSILRIIHNGWDPAVFVDLVQSVHEHQEDPRRGVAVLLKKLEWRMLFDDCLRGAAGK
jgi:hypothetical protein